LAAKSDLSMIERDYETRSYTVALDDKWPSRRRAEKLGGTVTRNFIEEIMRPLLNRTTGILYAILLLAGVACNREALRLSGFVDVPGGRVAFRVMGARDGIPLLMIHGGPGSTSCTYLATLTGVGASRPVVMYDQLHLGNSDRRVDLQRDAVLSRFVSEVAAIRSERS
jgi:hypothetical protein